MGKRQTGPGRPIYPGEYYASRLGKVLAYIDHHLHQPLALAELAALVAFSPFHFHRVFLDWQGETPQAYIRRARLTRAAALLQYAPQCPVREVAQLSGFTSPEAFVRAFRAFFGHTPSGWRKSPPPAPRAAQLPDATALWCAQRVQLRFLPRRRVAYQRKIGPYGEQEAQLWQRLQQLLLQAGHACDSAAPLCAIGIGLDDPRLTPAGRCRFDACIEIGAAQKLPVQIPLKWIGGGMHAVLPLPAEHPLGTDDKDAYWRWLFESWLPASGYAINSQPCFELYANGMPQAGGAGGALCLPLQLRR